MKSSTQKIGPVLKRLYQARNELRAMFPDFKFTLDGNLIGDIGEAIAQHDFGFEKLPVGVRGHDFKTGMGRKRRLVQIKTTQAVKGRVGLGVTMQTFDHLIVIQLTNEGGYGVLYDGPGTLIDEARSNRTTPSLSVNQLRALQLKVKLNQRLVPSSN
jgi:hypothetical protein